MKKIGMIGVGNMGGAILRGMIASGYVAAEDVMACLHSEEKRQALAAEIPGLTCTTDAKALAQECRMIVLAVKPQVLEDISFNAGDENMPPFELTINGEYVQQHLSGENKPTDLRKYIL